MDAILQYASNIIDISGAILEHAHGINRQQAQFVETIHHRTIRFANEYIEKREWPVQALRRYLNHDAMSPLTIVIGYSEWLIDGSFGELKDAYKEALEEIREYGYALQDEINDLHTQVWSFMQQMGIPKGNTAALSSLT
jgi:signal transduction histidine kinase